MSKNWPEQSRHLGKDHVRVDGPLKVSGKAKYASDQQPAGLLFGKILRAPWASAELHEVDLAPARAVPGVKAVVLARDVPRTIRYYGEEIAAVAADSRQACEEAISLIRLQATERNHAVDEKAALDSTSPRVFDDQPNVSAPRVSETGDVEAGFAASSAVVEGELWTQVQMHQCLEPHGNTVSYDGEELTIWASTQGVFAVRDGVADNIEMDQSKIRVLCEFMGGGFGSKLMAGVEAALASRLAIEAGAPVKLILSRMDEFLSVGNRPSSFQKIKIGADNEGKLTAFEMVGFGTGGFASGGTRPGGGGGTGVPMPYIYSIPNVRVTQYGVAVNAGSGRPMRAPGHPQASFGMEAVMDELAVRLNMDPLDLRLKNDPAELRRKCYEIAAEKFRWRDRYAPPGSSEGPVKRGIGLGGATWGGGGGRTQAEAQINPDGTVEVRCGTQDLGTGTTTLIAVVAAEALGLEISQIKPKLGDTRFPPSGSSGGSTTAPSVSPAIYDTCQKAEQALKDQSGMEDVRGDNWKVACQSLGVTPLVVQGGWREGLSSSGSHGVQMAEVDVDTETGFVKVNEIMIVQEHGLVVNKLTCESQAYGGAIMGLGLALYEQRIMDDDSGFVLNPNFETYKLPGIADIPEIKITLVDNPSRGVIGIGEPVTIPTAAAIGNAVANAIGVRVNNLPITPPKVLAALGKVPEYEPIEIAWEKLSQAG
jgi:xanthine dehydrogenase YagR molybdenum-binding subunit